MKYEVETHHLSIVLAHSRVLLLGAAKVAEVTHVARMAKNFSFSRRVI